MNRLLIALTTAVCCVFGSMNSFVYAESETEEETTEVQEAEQPAEGQISEDSEQPEEEEEIREEEVLPEETQVTEETVTEEAEDKEEAYNASETDPSYFSYEMVNGEVTLTGYTGSEGNVVVPAYINGYPVTAIADGGFAGQSVLESIVLPDTLRVIGSGGFYDCPNLKSIWFPDSLESIGMEAFGNTWFVEEIHVESIKGWLSVEMGDDDSNPFFNPYSQEAPRNFYVGDELITDLVIPDDVTVIPRRAFRNVESITSVTIPANVITIGEYAFENCLALESAEIEDGVQIIENGAFYWSGLKEIYIPDSVTDLGEEAFYGCEFLESVHLPAGISEIKYGTFDVCFSLGSIEIPENITSIGPFAFYGCQALTSVEIPGTVETLGQSAFDECSSLESVTLGEGVSVIGDRAFQTTGLIGIEIPASITSIGRWAFYSASSMNEIVFWGNAPSISNQAMPNRKRMNAYYPADNPTWTPDKFVSDVNNYGYITWIPFDTENAKPVFSGHQLILSGTLGLNFGVKFPADFDDTDSYVTFTVNGQDQTVYTADAEIAGDRRVYTCCLNTLQMAEEIKAVFHYGGYKSVSQTYSLRQYFEYFDEHESSYDEKTLNLVHAVADYGYFAQPYLIDLHHLADKYAIIEKHYGNSFDYEEIKPKVAQYTFAKGISDSAVSNASYKLSLDADTAVSVVMLVPAGTELTASSAFGGKTYTAVQETPAQYVIKVTGIKASQLGSTITVSGSAEGNFTITVSALSYVRSVLNNSSYSTKAKNAVAALYKYYEAVEAYRTAG